ncbi:AAA-domain-containing protein, partial [Bimuria novae-zelandiae CBS 107.79]
GWSDIQLDVEIEETIKQMVDQPANTGRAAYGILKKGRIGGALLYGPPGTGKTHLARVLARECQATMLSASAADIVSMWVGETEKAIKGLFNLGRMLAPSIIFIDEADSLFHARGPGDRSWERSRTNQLLTEMDGLVKLKTAPFVLLATNFPRQLDHAVLRRTPSRLHIGLPSFEGRKNIFRICLREETVNDDVDWEDLSRKSMGYSGSDIQIVCVQAALICQASPTDVDAQGIRILKKVHFDRAFLRSAPTVSAAALSQIREFAKEFDPGTWSKMKADSEMQSRAAARDEIKTARDYYVLHKPNWPPPVWEDSGASERDHVDSAGRIEEIESSAGEEPEDESTEVSALRYLPLAPCSKKIRVLSIEPRPSEGNNSELEPLKCTLENVSLEDWSELYRHTCGFENSQTTKHLKGQRHDKLLLWQLANVVFHRRTSGKPMIKDDDPEDVMRQLEEEVLPLLNSNFDTPMEEMELLKPRYVWGDYIALSYVWGDPRKTREIYVNGHRFGVGENLYLALRKLQSSFEVAERRLKVWIDAICINQNDIAERAQEVKKMDMIYSEAIAVRAWVGVPPSNTMSELHTAKRWLDNIRDTKLNDVVAALVPDNRTAHALWTLASTIFYEPYWQRLWIMQEIALAPAILLWYGDCHYTIAEISKLYHLLSDGGLGSALPAAFGGTSQVIELQLHCAVIFSRLVRLRRWENTFEKEQLPVTDIVHLAQSAAAIDPRDKVYGLLALVSKDLAAGIQPSYAADVGFNDICASFAKACFLTEGNLNTLARVQMFLTRPLDFPSWAFDLSTGPTPTLILTRHKSHAANGKRISIPHFSEDNTVMRAEGVFVDTIETLAMALHQGETEVWEPMDPPIDPTTTDTGPHLLPVDESSKLALARCLAHDSNYEFSQGPSLLDVPWLPVDEMPEIRNGQVSIHLVAQDTYQHDAIRQWPTFTQISPLNVVVRSMLHPNAFFPIHGVPLRHYFSNTDELCPDPEAFHDMGKFSIGVSTDRRLCTTTSGLIGMAPKYAKPGDRVAVMTGCDMPFVLRPKDENYEFIGAAFVEGLMKGEAIESVERGELTLETIGIC